VTEAHLSKFEEYLRFIYGEVKSGGGEVVNYVGMTFDFRVKGEVSVTMDGCIADILQWARDAPNRANPCTDMLFDTKEVAKASLEDGKWFHSHVQKMLYLAKRVRPECLLTVPFLSTRVGECDEDDIEKLYASARIPKGVT
jgi:hypothetical protein